MLYNVSGGGLLPNLKAQPGFVPLPAPPGDSVSCLVIKDVIN